MDAEVLVQLILLLPLAGALINGIVPLFLEEYRQRETLLGTIGNAVVAIPFVITVYLFATYNGSPIVVDYFTWMAAGDLDLSFAYRVDELSLLMTLIITGVGGVIHLYSVGYMHGDPGFWRYFAYLNLFIFAMLNLVLADNLVVLFLGWEGVGLCSYLLIGFWYTNLANSSAANKAFIVNRIGDFAFLLAMFLIFRELGSLDFSVLLGSVDALSQTTINWAVLLFFIGATGKSAQIPLFVWLPDAMAGPTPVSALIHAATMVTAGLYLLARISPLVLASPTMMTVIAVVGALTALMAATIALTQYDIKKVLAYSTVSQLGFMFMAAGVGAFFVAIFHVITHAFFKACLFLGSGSVIHEMEHVKEELHEKGHEAEAEAMDPQDMRTMGGLERFMPSTSATFLISTLAIAGIPGLAGFFSKDEILFKAFEYGFDGEPYAFFVWAVGLITAFLTAAYMTRCYVLTFRREPRWPEADTVRPHESPWTMTVPLWTLGTLAIVGGYIGLPEVFAGGDWNWIHQYLGSPYGGPVAEPEIAATISLGLKWALIVFAALIAITGVVVTWRQYNAHGLEVDERLQNAFGGLYTLWQDKYHWDEAYDRTIVNPLLTGSEKGLWRFDDYIIDGAVNGVARLAKSVSEVAKYIQTGFVQNYAMAMVIGAVLVIALLLFG